MHIYQILAIYGPKLLIFHGKFSKLRPVIGHGHRTGQRALLSPHQRCFLFALFNLESCKKVGFYLMRHLIFRKLSASISLKLIQFVFTSPHTQIGMSIVNTCYLLQHWEPKENAQKPSEGSFGSLGGHLSSIILFFAPLTCPLPLLNIALCTQVPATDCTLVSAWGQN